MLVITDYNNTSNCMSEGDYRNNTDDREVLLWVYYKFNGNTNHLHYPDSDDVFNSTEYVKVTNCGNNKISGEFSGTYIEYNSIDGLETPDTLVLTEGVFENIEFNVVN